MAETYYALTDITKLIDKLIAAMPTSFYSGIMAVRGSLVTAPAANVVARDCYDRLLAENDELRKERPVRHGRWIEKHWSTEDDWGVINWYSLTCSACGHEERTNGLSPNSIYKYDYCPFCGARMDGDEE